MTVEEAISKLLEANPVQNLLYGGISTGGGYENNTEYEVGAQRLAEAIHCILGSLGGEGAQKIGFGWESDHIIEELGIVNYVIQEYSLPLYKQDNWLNNSYKKQSILSIIKASKALKEQAFTLQIEMSTVENERSVIKEAALICYEILIILATEMSESVNIPDSHYNAFQNKELKNAILKLTSVLNTELRNNDTTDSFSNVNA
jgi:hypothetical protein